MRQENVVIVGGGPAGAYCAYELGKLGISAVIFDHSHPREKPCGGGITPRALEKFSFLEQCRSEGQTCSSFKILSSTNREFHVENYTGYNISRCLLDLKMLNMAKFKGARLIEEKVIEVKKFQKKWKIKSNKQTYTAKILIGADGVNSIVRRKTVGAISNENLTLAYGYLTEGIAKKSIIIKYLDTIPGYIWIFPRKHDTSVGIGSKLQYGNVLKEKLDKFMRSKFIRNNYPRFKIFEKFAALIPSAEHPEFFDKSCSGNNWILVGDAAGHVDPISGEGILYAIWSGKLAAQAVKEKRLDLFDSSYKKEYGYYLMKQSSRKKIFYNPVALEFLLNLHYSHKRR